MKIFFERDARENFFKNENIFSKNNAAFIEQV